MYPSRNRRYRYHQRRHLRRDHLTCHQNHHHPEPIARSRPVWLARGHSRLVPWCSDRKCLCSCRTRHILRCNLESHIRRPVHPTLRRSLQTLLHCTQPMGRIRNLSRPPAHLDRNQGLAVAERRQNRRLGRRTLDRRIPQRHDTPPRAFAVAYLTQECSQSRTVEKGLTEHE